MQEQNQETTGIFIAIEGLSATNRTEFSKMVLNKAIDAVAKKGSSQSVTLCKGVRNCWNPVNQKGKSATLMLQAFADLEHTLKNNVVPELQKGNIVILDGYLNDIYAAYGVRYGLETEYEAVKSLASHGVAFDELRPDVQFLRWEGAETTFEVPPFHQLNEAAADEELEKMKHRVLMAYQHRVMDNPNVFTVVDTDVTPGGTTAIIVDKVLEELLNPVAVPEIVSTRGCTSYFQHLDDAAFADLSIGEQHDKVYKEVVVGKNQSAISEYAVMNPPGTLPT